jgi:hypothetical protein
MDLVQSLMVLVHPFGKLGIGLRLDFHMNQDPGFGAIQGEDADEFVDVLTAGFGVVVEGLEFLVEEDDVTGPVDARLDGWKAESEERAKEVLESLLPGTIEVVLFAAATHPVSAASFDGSPLSPDLLRNHEDMNSKIQAQSR